MEFNYLSSEEVVQKCRDVITSHLENSIYDEGALWYNEYGGIDRDDELSKKLVRFRDTEDFKIVTMINTDRSALFFKILPVKMKSRMVPFSGTQKTTNWDGYFIDAEQERQPELIVELNQLCLDKTSTMVNGWGMDSDENRVWLAPRLEMYLAC
jgi:hypothetical protein